MTPASLDRAPFDVVALVTSAGGLEALSAVLRDLPPDFPVAVIVVQHLGGQASSLVSILRRRIGLSVSWAEDGAPIVPGQVLACPPGRRLEILPDRTCSLSPGEPVGRGRPIDFFLESLADSLGGRALAVVLTGMGEDGASGARALKQAGGTVLVQSEETAEHPSMPRAAVAAGAADLVLPLYEIAPVLSDLVSGGKLPRPRTEVEAVEALFAGAGEARAVLRGIDWSTTPLGPVSRWPPILRTTVRLVLDSRFPMIVFWGPELVLIGNDASAPALGTKGLQGVPGRATWADLWGFLRTEHETIAQTGEAIYWADRLLEVNRDGLLEEAYFTYCHSPLYEDGAFAGILSTSLETTDRVLAERRLAILRALAEAGSGVRSETEAIAAAARVLAAHPRDVPFALVYLVDRSGGRAALAGTVGVEEDSPAAPRTIHLKGGHPAWPLAPALEGDGALFVDDLAHRFRGFHAGPYPEAPRSALVLPLPPPEGETPSGALVLGLSSRIGADVRYRDFALLVAAQVSASLAAARVRQVERERLDRLAELDRVKIEFFSNVSHEFRTPLTLLLAPLEELRRRREEIPAALAEEIDVASRNARRLLTLVNSLLDFSQMEAGRLRTCFELTDLDALTAGIASVFKSAAQRAGLALRVDCRLARQVWVDPEMWEKIVSNLLSNALKFTFTGAIEVALRALPQHAELTVRDTGVGIPDDELPHLFKRFHRVRGARGRTQEGSGIGLALVHGLVRRHHGRVRLQSREGQETTVTVWIPLAAPPAAEIRPRREEGRGREEGIATAMAEEAAQWDAPGIEDDPLGAPEASLLRSRAHGARVLVVDDNADMRKYLRRLLSHDWRIETARDGEEALALARETRPDLILADVMLPHVDGFELVRLLRRDEELKQIPVILVTARAGEEAGIEGLLAGADDYVVKPFSARELVARVGAQIELSRLRRGGPDLLARQAADPSERHPTGEALTPAASTAEPGRAPSAPRRSGPRDRPP